MIHRWTRATLFLPLALAVAGCGGQDPLLGAWTGPGMQDNTLVQPFATEDATNLSGTVTVEANGTDAYTIVYTGQTEMPCTLAGARSGDGGVTITPGQPCAWRWFGGEPMSATVTSGAISIDRATDTITLQLAYSFRFALRGGTDATGTGTRTVTGSRTAVVAATDAGSD